jgi:farnesyl-diphosphate farnesyltransferase
MEPKANQLHSSASSVTDSAGLLTDLLKEVSRSFYLTLRVLPGPIRRQIGVAYLLARATDTIADTDLVPVDDRLTALGRLRRRILGDAGVSLDLRRFAVADLVTGAGPGRRPGVETRAPSAGERRLLERIEEPLALLGDFTAEDQTRIRDVLRIIATGQEQDLRRFGGAGEGTRQEKPALIALQTDAELDNYAYQVAGCVGEFWTRMCRAHLFPTAPVDEARLLADGIRFGKGLQLVNILRDLPRDLRLGRCYLPAAGLSDLGLAPADLLQPSNEQQLRPLYDRWLAQAEDHLEAGWAYTLVLPRDQLRVRLACAWPILIGMKTLARLRREPVLDPAHRVTVHRAEVYGIMARSLLACCFPGRWARLFEKTVVWRAG